MTLEKITRTEKDQHGDITALCGGDSKWGKVPKGLAIENIENGYTRYYVEDANGIRANVEVYTLSGVKHLRTDPDSSCLNNLDNLPDC